MSAAPSAILSGFNFLFISLSSLVLRTTTEAVAQTLAERKNLRIITNNLNVAACLCGNSACEVIVAGGVVRSDHGVIGESTIDFIR